MRDNIVYNEWGEAIGFYKDLKEMLVRNTINSLKGGNYERAIEGCEELQELKSYEDYNDLILLSDNNGAGFTATPYK